MNEQNNLSDKYFRAGVRAHFGSRNGKITLMTRETHPEVMSLYAQLCEKAGVPQRPIYLVESEKLNASVLPLTNKIVISTAELANSNPEELCAIFGHEQRHLTKQQLMNRMLIYYGIAHIPFGIVMLADAAFKLPVNGSDLILVNCLIPSAMAALVAQFYYAEYDSDKAAATFAGSKAELASLKKLSAEAAKTGNKKHSLFENLPDPTHPSLEKRIKRIERFAAREETKKKLPRNFDYACYGAE